MRRRSVPGCVGKCVAYFHTFDGLDAHHRGRQSTIETLVPLPVGAQTYWHAIGDDFEHATQGVARRPGGADELSRGAFERCVAGPNRRVLDRGPPLVRCAITREL